MACSSASPWDDSAELHSTLPIRELRDLTRRRRQLIGENSRERNRVQKVLEDANVKLGGVLSDVFCVSGRLMLQALLDGSSVRIRLPSLRKEGTSQNSADSGFHRRPSPHRSPTLPDPPRSTSSAVSRRRGRGSQPGDPQPYGRSSSRRSVLSATEHSRHQGGIGSQHPGRGRCRHPTVSDRRSAQLVGGTVSCQSRKAAVWRRASAPIEETFG